MTGAAILSTLSMKKCRRHYLRRVKLSKQMRARFKSGDATKFSKLALGIDDENANYSAVDHPLPLGPIIRTENTNADKRLLDYARKIMADPSLNLASEIDALGLSYCKISVASEIACMLRPKRYWIANRRTLWASIWAKKGNVDEANEILKLFSAGMADSGMDYAMWKSEWPKLKAKLLLIAADADAACNAQGVTPGKKKFLWADAVASIAYMKYAENR